MDLHGTVYPCTILPARYSGVYEGGQWVAFACEPWEVPQDAFEDDCTCMAWWRTPTVLVAADHTPDGAHDLLLKALRRVKKAADRA